MGKTSEHLCDVRLASKLVSMNSVLLANNAWVVHFPSTGGEDVFVLLVPMTVDNFAWVRLVLLNTSVLHKTDVVMHVEVEKRATFSTRLGHD